MDDIYGGLLPSLAQAECLGEKTDLVACLLSFFEAPYLPFHTARQCAFARMSGASSFHERLDADIRMVSTRMIHVSGHGVKDVVYGNVGTPTAADDESLEMETSMLGSVGEDPISAFPAP